jgi:RecA-family ATPase
VNAIPLRARYADAEHIDFGAETLNKTREKPADVWSLPLIDTTRWITDEPPERRWIVPGWLARGTGCLFVGEDGVGKSLLAQQLVTAVAAGKRFLGLDTVQVPTLYITCEDSDDELHRRQQSINDAIGIPRLAAPAGMSSLAGYTDTGLGWFDEFGRFQLSPVFHGIAAAAKERGAGLIVLDNVAHLFNGNENARRDVAAFCSALDRMAIDCDATVVALAHPNKGGAEYSGSTGWSAHVRQRWFLERPEDALDRDARVLRKSKSNYASSGDEIAFRWHQWAFVTDNDLPEDRLAELASVAADAGDNALFLACLDARTRDGLIASPNVSPNYAPSQFEAMPEAKRIGKQRLRAAMERLRMAGLIEIYDHQNADKGRVVKAIRRSPERPRTPPNGSPDVTPDAPRTCSRTLPERTPDQTPDAPAHTPPYYVREGGASEGPPPSWKNWALASPDDPDTIDFEDDLV